MTRILGPWPSRLLQAYYTGPDHPMKLRLWTWLRRWSGYPRLTIPYADGGWLTIDERDWPQGCLFAAGRYEGEVWDTLAAAAGADETLWDVGAFIGSVSALALLDLRVREVHAFEPDPITHELLVTNLRLNGARWTAHRIALADEIGQRQLFRGPTVNTGLSSLAQRAGSECFEVECRTMDSLVFEDGLRAPTLLKIDVEGWEARVLCGARRTLALHPPKAIVYESAYDRSPDAGDTALREYLEGMGYAVRWIRRPDGAIESRENYAAIRSDVASPRLADAGDAVSAR